MAATSRFTTTWTPGVSDNPAVRLWYSWVWTATPEPESADYRVNLATTVPCFGGVRWWFICPLAIDGQLCGRWVGKLHLPPIGSGMALSHEAGLPHYEGRDSLKDLQ